MKNNYFNLRLRSRWLLVSLLAILAGASPAWGDELTFNDGTGTNQYLPVFGNYVDTQNTVSEFIIPSDRLEDLAGATISGMTFYLSTPQTGAWGEAVFEVYMKEVTATGYTLASANSEGTNTIVYTGSLDGSQSTMGVPFANNYTYSGGNLLIGFKVTTKGSWKGTYFYGESMTYGTNNAFHYATSSQNGKDSFLPKVTFIYTPGAGVVKKPTSIIASNVTANSATISWTAGSSETSWEISCSTSSSEPAEEGSYISVNTTPSYNLTGLTTGTTYYVYVRAIDGVNHSKWSSVCSFTPGVLIINDVSTTSNNYVPIYGNYMDDHSRSQFIFPKTSLVSVKDQQITKIVFYGTATNTAKFANKTFDVYLKETDDATISTLSDWATLEKVYSGNLTITDGQMVITFNDGFDYSGNNLLIGINQTDDDTDYTSTTWTGVSATGASLGGYGTSISQRNFLPKTSIYYSVQSSAPKMKVEAESSYDFKFLTSSSTTESKTATFEVQNKGNAALTDANVSYTGDAAISLSATGTLASIAAKGSTEITITVNTETPGTYAGTITVTGTGSDDVVIPVKAIVRNTDKLFVDFDEANPKPSTWTLGSGWSVNAGGYATIGGTATDITTAEILSVGETVLLRYRGNNADATLAVSYCATVDGDYTACTETVASISTEDWQTATFTIPAEAKFIKINGKYIDLDAVYGCSVASVPVMVLSATEHNFGLVSDAEAQAFTFTVKNEGGAMLNGFSVSSDNPAYSITDGEGNVLGTSIAAGASQTVKVVVNTVGQQNATLTISGDGIDNQTVALSGYMLDDTKVCETFATQPNRWTASSGWSYNATTGAYSTTYGGATLTSPKIDASAGGNLVISAKSAYSGSSYYLKIEGSSDNGSTWSAYSKSLSTASDPALSTTDFTIVTLSDVPTTVNRLRITAYYAYINALNGFTYDEDPQLGLYSNEACTTTQASTAEKNWGFVTSDQEQKYYIKNNGTGTIDLTIEQADGFTAAVGDAALTEGESTALTISMAATEGLHNGTVTLTAKNHKTGEMLGTLAVALNGAVAGTKNDINFASLSALPAGWETEKWTVTANSYVGNTSSAADLTSQTFTVTAGETMLVEVKCNYSWQTPSLTYSFNNGEATALSGISSSDWKVYELTGAPTGNVKVKFTGAYVNIRRFYGFEEASVPVMEFTAADKAFGMITTAATSDAYTITNSGAGVLNNLSVSCSNSNFAIAIVDDATSIAANGGTATFTVTLNTTVAGLQTGTVTVSGDGVESKTFNVSGYVADGTKIFETFATALPDRWENTEAAVWTISNSAAYAPSYSYSGGYKYATLESPKIKVAEGEKLAISAKLAYSGSYYVKVEGSSDNGATWEAYSKSLSNDVLNNTDYTVVEIDDIPTTVNKIRLVGYYVYVNGLNGFTYDDNDPQMGIFSDSEFASEITTGTATNNWGFVSEDKTATYYIKNTGTGMLTLSKTDAPAGFAATLGSTSLAAGESTTLVVSMAYNAETNEGYHGGDVVLTGKDSSDETLGTFTVTSSGVVVGSKTDINFASLSDFPAGWEATNWSVTSGVAKANSWTAGTLTTGTYTVAAGEKLIIEAKGNNSSSYYKPTLTYKYSTDGSEPSTTGTSTLSYAYSASDYQLQVIDDIPAGENVKIQFTGSYIDIRRIYGFTAVAKPVMALSPAATSYDFQMQTAAADYVITVTNTGTADMTNLAAALTGDDKDDFEVAVSKTTVPCTGENTATITVMMKASTEYKTHSATLTISADGLADKVITLTGRTRDADKWYVDFASEIPSSFVEQGSWTVSSGASRTISSTENSLITQPINLAAGEKIYFDAYNPYSGSLKVRYSMNGGISWSDYVDYTAAINTSGSFSSHEIDLENASAVTAIIEFKGRYYIQLDNVYGGELNNTASMIKVTKSAATVENGATVAFGSISTEATATYTITNVGNGTLTITSPVATTGAATAAVNATSLANAESATLTITMPVAAPYEYKEGAVTVETSLGDFVINYNATVLNPNVLDEQFASGKPAGWYFGGYWQVYSQLAENTASGVADLITEQLAVAGTSDVLTFQVAKTGSSAATFKVYTSQDRIEWTEQTVTVPASTSYQDVNISGLSAGDYYVKISGARVKVDNFLGWEKKNNARDLYVTATSIPTTLTATYTATATVTSLIAAETGVYAKLFFGDTEVATATAADVALNGSTTFTMSTESAPIEGLYKAKIVVYYSDNSVAFTTGITNVGTLVLDENEAFTAEAGEYGTVIFKRTFAEGWNGAVLPFDMSISNVKSIFNADAVKDFSGVTVDDFDGTVTLNFTNATEVKAGRPFVMKNTEAGNSYEINGVIQFATELQPVIQEDGDVKYTFTGSYAAKTDLTDVVFALINGNKFYYHNTGKPSNAKAFRAWFVNESTDAVAGARVNFNFDSNDVVTGISELNANGMADFDRVYNLQGQRVENAKKGLFIQNGKKVVIK